MVPNDLSIDLRPLTLASCACFVPLASFSAFAIRYGLFLSFFSIYSPKSVFWFRVTCYLCNYAGMHFLHSRINSNLLETKKKILELKIQQINLGTTHFVNSVVPRSPELAKVGVIRIATKPNTESVPAFFDFPEDLAKVRLKKDMVKLF